MKIEKRRTIGFAIHRISRSKRWVAPQRCPIYATVILSSNFWMIIPFTLKYVHTLESEKLVFESSPISNAFICGSIKYRPHFQMAVSSYNNKMTLSVNLYGSQEDRDSIKEFFTLIEEELLNILLL